jgi:hypothetical protein
MNKFGDDKAIDVEMLFSFSICLNLNYSTIPYAFAPQGETFTIHNSPLGKTRQVDLASFIITTACQKFSASVYKTTQSTAKLI